MKLHVDLPLEVTGGEPQTIYGDSVEEIAVQLPDGDEPVVLEVRDEAGFTRGWVRSRADWQVL